jgi:hypothetical protein
MSKERIDFKTNNAITVERDTNGDRQQNKKNEAKRIVEQPPYHCDSFEIVLEKLKTTLDGLTEEEANKRLVTYGTNQLKGEGGVSTVLLE